jgi:hypothetical protein
MKELIAIGVTILRVKVKGASIKGNERAKHAFFKFNLHFPARFIR